CGEEHLELLLQSSELRDLLVRRARTFLLSLGPIVFVCLWVLFTLKSTTIPNHPQNIVSLLLVTTAFRPTSETPLNPRPKLPPAQGRQRCPRTRALCHRLEAMKRDWCKALFNNKQNWY
ncbi:unnamed protein product, partial [Laminaria digitata]